METKIKNPEFHARLKVLIGDMPPFRWAAQVGLSNTAFQRIWHQGTIPSPEKLVGIVESTRVSLDWLLLGRGPMYAEEKMPGQVCTEVDDRFVGIPLVAAELGAGNGQVVDKENGLSLFHFQKTWLKQKATSISNLVLMFVRGDSMLPVLDDGDLVMVDQGRTSIHSGKIYAVNIGGDALYVKRLTSVGKKLQVISDNRQVYPPFEIFSQEARVIGQVIWCGREL